MKRRELVHFGIVVLAMVPGCGGREPDEVHPRLKVFAENVERTNSEWVLRARVENALNQEVGANDVAVVAFNDEGEEVCREHVGDLERQEVAGTVAVTCTEFPSIIAVTAEESPCDGALLQTIYWVGTDEQRDADLPSGTIVWENYYRECNDDLPPQRALDGVNQSTSTPQEE